MAEKNNQGTNESVVNQQMTSAKCETQIPDVKGLNDNELTVGRHFYLHCTGKWTSGFDFSKAFIVMDEKQKPMIRVFKTEARDLNSFDIDLTFYVAGELKFDQMILSDGEKKIDLGAHQFKLTSQIEQKNDPQTGQPAKPEPFGYEFASLSWPFIYTLFIVGLFCSFIITGFLYLLAQNRKKNLFAQIKNFDTPVSPDSQFYKTLRQFERNEFKRIDFDKMCRVYLLRSFEVPFFDLGDKKIVKYLKQKFPRLKNERRQVYQFLQDLKILDDKSKNDFLKNFYKFIDHVESLKSKNQILTTGVKK